VGSRLSNGGNVARRNGFAGALDSTGKVMLPFEYDEVEQESDDRFLRLKKNGKFGIADSTGRVLAQPVFDQVERLYAGAVAFRRGGSYGWLSLHNGQQHPSAYELSRSYIDDQIFSLAKGELRGLLHEERGEIVPVKYEWLRRGYPGTFVCRLNGKEGLLGADGKELAAPVFDDVQWSWEDSVVRVKQHGKTGLINPRGSIAIPPKYDALQRFNRGQAVAVLNGKYGVLDLAGRELVPFQYDRITTTDALGRELLDYAEKREVKDTFLAYSTEKAGRHGLLAWNGQPLLPPVYDRVSVGVINGRAYLYVVKNGKTGLYSREGKELIPPVYDQLWPADKSNSGFTYYATDAARPAAEQMIRAEKDGLSGLFSLEGKVVAPVRYERIRWESNGLLELKNGDTTAIATAAGKIIRAPQPNVYYQMVAPDRIVEGVYGNYRMTGLDGTVLYQLPELEVNKIGNRIGDSSYFYSGLMKAGDYRNQNVFVTRNGQEVRFSEYDKVGVFFEGLAYAVKGDKAGFIDSTGKAVVPVEWDDIRNVSSGIYQYKRVEKNKMYGLIDRAGRLILPAEYENIGVTTEGYFSFRKNGRYGLADSTGRIILPPEYSDISPNTSAGGLALRKDGLAGFASYSGAVIIPAEYETLSFNYGWDVKGWPVLAKRGDAVIYFSKDGRQLPVKAAKILER